MTYQVVIEATAEREIRAMFPNEIRELLYGRRRNVFRILFTIHDDTVSILFVHHSAQQELEP